CYCSRASLSYLHALPPVLPSFPTRRSSDLTPTWTRPGGSCVPRSSGPSCGASTSATSTATCTRSSSSPSSSACTSSSQSSSSCRDRKSTRLNSSHVKISYAVFCLKKKKKTN